MNDIYEIEFYFTYNFKYVHLHIDIYSLFIQYLFIIIILEHRKSIGYL